jgi:uncharacterized membrane protein YccC
VSTVQVVVPWLVVAAAILSRSQSVFAVLLTGLLCFALGVLIGHLFFPQYVLVVGP